MQLECPKKSPMKMLVLFGLGFVFGPVFLFFFFCKNLHDKICTICENRYDKKYIYAHIQLDKQDLCTG